jgi:hypothetical protein
MNPHPPCAVIQSEAKDLRLPVPRPCSAWARGAVSRSHEPNNVLLIRQCPKRSLFDPALERMRKEYQFAVAGYS